MTKEELTKFFVAALDAQQKAHLMVVEMIEAQILVEREACAKLAESYEPRCETCPRGVANAIRARGKA